MYGTGEHHSERGQPGSKDQQSYVFPHMQTLDLDKYTNVVGLGSHDKWRAHMGGMELGSKPKI
jgi:hypothetical protein